MPCTGCGIFSDSNSNQNNGNDSIVVSGGATISASSVGTEGGVNTSGGSTVTPTPTTGDAAVSNPSKVFHSLHARLPRPHWAAICPDGHDKRGNGPRKLGADLCEYADRRGRRNARPGPFDATSPDYLGCRWAKLQRLCHSGNPRHHRGFVYLDNRHTQQSGLAASTAGTDKRLATAAGTKVLHLTEYANRRVRRNGRYGPAVLHGAIPVSPTTTVVSFTSTTVTINSPVVSRWRRFKR